MTIYSIYRFTNLVNGKVYIGLTTQKQEHRLADHKWASKNKDTYLYKAMRKYGFANFKFDVIFSIITSSLEDLKIYEKHFINEYDCCLLDGRNKGYNMTRGGESFDSESASHRNKKLISDGTHIFQTAEFKKLRAEMNENRLKNGTHNFQGEVQSARATKRNNENVAKGLNPFAGKDGSGTNESRIAAGTHNFIIERTCPHCNLTGKGYNMIRYHLDNCKARRP